MRDILNLRQPVNINFWCESSTNVIIQNKLEEIPFLLGGRNYERN